MQELTPSSNFERWSVISVQSPLNSAVEPLPKRERSWQMAVGYPRPNQSATLIRAALPDMMSLPKQASTGPGACYAAVHLEKASFPLWLNKQKTRNSHAPTWQRRRAFSLSNIISLLPYSRGTSGNLIFLLSMQHPTCPLLWWHLYRTMRIIQKRIGPVELELSSSLDAQLSSIPAKVWETNPIKRWTPCR